MSKVTPEASPKTARPGKGRLAVRASRSGIQRVGLRRQRGRDLYHWLIGGSWLRLLGTISTIYLGSAFCYALLFLLVPGSIDNGRPGSLVDAFNFSIQTLSTIGYGTLGPANGYAHFLVMTEMLFSLLLTAVATGLVFAKFARPTARLLFSKVALVGQDGDHRQLTFRVANERDSWILDAHFHVSYVRTELTAGGESVVRLHDLKLRKAVAPVLSLTWNVVHEIGPDSPLYGTTAESMGAENGALVVNVSGVDNDLSAAVHAHHSYETEEIVWGARFVDVIVFDDTGLRRVLYDRFHDYQPQTRR